MSTTTLIGVTALRDLAAEALAPVDDTDPPVIVDYADSFTPPVLMIIEGDPWITAGTGQRPTMGPCLYTARLVVLIAAARLEPGPGIRVLEELEAYVLGRMQADAYTWPLESITGAREFPSAGLPFLGARVTYLVPITV